MIKNRGFAEWNWYVRSFFGPDDERRDNEMILFSGPRCLPRIYYKFPEIN